MLFYRSCDRYFLKCRSKLLRHLTCILISPVCCTKAWHCNRCNYTSVHAKCIKCLRCHKKCQCRIQSSGNTYYCTLCMCMCQAFLKSHRLNGKDFFTSSGSLALFSRHKRSGIKCSRKLCLLYLHIKRNTHKLSVFHKLECRILPSLTEQTFYIYLCINNIIYKTLSHCKSCSVLSDNIMSAKHNICRRFTFSGIGINITAQKSCRLPLDQILSVCCLSDRLITC